MPAWSIHSSSPAARSAPAMASTRSRSTLAYETKRNGPDGNGGSDGGVVESSVVIVCPDSGVALAGGETRATLRYVVAGSRYGNRGESASGRRVEPDVTIQ